MVSPYLLRPLRTLDEAMRDIKRLREYWEGSGTAPSLDATLETSGAIENTAGAKKKPE